MIQLGYAPMVRSLPVPLYMQGISARLGLGQDEFAIDPTMIDVGSELTPPTFEDPNAPLFLMPGSAYGMPVAEPANPLTALTLTPPTTPPWTPVNPNQTFSAAQQAALYAAAAANAAKATAGSIAPSPRVATRAPGAPAPSSSPIAGSTVIAGKAIPNLALIGGGALLLLALTRGR